jgi:hypothetical protein
MKFIDLASELWPSSLTVDMPEIDYAPMGGLVEVLASRVILYNDNVHTFDEVIAQVAKATGHSRRDCARMAWEVHARGQASIFEGELFDCLQVSSVLEEIALHTQVMT